jgi:hypothetical protein
MRIALVTPAGPGMRNGNRHTALRWAAFLRGAGHKVDVSVQWAPDSRVHAMLALHARRSYQSIKTFSSDKLLVVALTGTDVYRDIHDSAEARESLELAHRLIVLQPKAAQELPPGLRRKVRVVVQSCPTRLRHDPVGTRFRVCVIGHLRAEKDPLRTLAALSCHNAACAPGPRPRPGAIIPGKQRSPTRKTLPPRAFHGTDAKEVPIISARSSRSRFPGASSPWRSSGRSRTAHRCGCSGWSISAAARRTFISFTGTCRSCTRVCAVSKLLSLAKRDVVH